MFSTDPTEGLGQFFDVIWGPDAGLVYLPLKNERGSWSKTFFHWPAKRDLVIEHVLANTATGNEVYFSPVLWDKAKPDDKSSIKQSRVLWADFDGTAPLAQDWTEAVSEAARSTQEAAPGPPSIVIQSSSEKNQHVYWRLDEPSTDMEWLENTNRSIAYTYGADTSGWDAQQILRPPFTTNHKRSLPVLLSNFDDTQYTASSFSSFRPVIQLVKDSVDTDNLPDPLQLIGKYVWPTDDLDLLQKDIPQGRRSSAYMRIAFKCAELGMTDTEAYSVLLYLDDRIGKFKTRSDRKKRLLDLVNKARQKYPRGLEEPTFAGLLSVKETATDTQQIFGFKSFLSADLHVDWAIKDFMPQDGCGVIASPPGIGKTQVSTQFAIHQALGKNFLGYEINKPLPSMFFSLEMGKPGFHRLLSAMAPAFTSLELNHLETNVHVVPLGEPMPLDKAEARTFFEGAIEKHGPKAIFIDSLQKVITGDIKDDEAVRKFFNYIASVRVKYGVYVWVIHHTRKAQGDNKRPRELSDVYGSTYITAEPDTVMSLWRDPNDPTSPIQFKELKNRYAEERPEFSIRRGEHLTYSTDAEGIVNAARMDPSNPLGIVPSGEAPPRSNTQYPFG